MNTHSYTKLAGSLSVQTWALTQKCVKPHVHHRVEDKRKLNMENKLNMYNPNSTKAGMNIHNRT